MQNNQVPDSGKKAAIVIGFINVAVIIVMLLCYNKKDLDFLPVFLSCLLMVINLILMIVYIIKRKMVAWIACLVFLLLMPVIGFCFLLINMPVFP